MIMLQIKHLYDGTVRLSLKGKPKHFDLVPSKIQGLKDQFNIDASLELAAVADAEMTSEYIEPDFDNGILGGFKTSMTKRERLEVIAIIRRMRDKNGMFGT